MAVVVRATQDGGTGTKSSSEEQQKKRRRGRQQKNHKKQQDKHVGAGTLHMEKKQQQQRQQQQQKRQQSAGEKTHQQDGSNRGKDRTTSTAILLRLTNPQDGSQMLWYEYGRSNLSGRDDTVLTHPPPPHAARRGGAPPPELVQRYRARADDLYRSQLQRANALKRGGDGGSGLTSDAPNRASTADGDMRWVESTLHKGTLKDRIAAMSVLVSTDPIHKLYALDGLLQLAGCNTASTGFVGGGGASNSASSSGNTNTRVARMAAEALEDLFLNTLLPPDRKLYTLAQRPLHLYDHHETTTKTASTTTASTTLSPRVLLLWRYEEIVQQKFHLFVDQYLSRTLRDGRLEQDKVFCLRCVANLLSSSPECESILLSLLVDKLGDPNKKVAAQAAHQLRSEVLWRHPAMQPVVAREVQQLTHRPNLSAKALYNCIVFLNQLKLAKPEHDDDDDDDDKNRPPSLAESLITTYFRLFEVAIAHTSIAHRNDKEEDPSSLSSSSKAKKSFATTKKHNNRGKKHKNKGSSSSGGKRLADQPVDEDEAAAMKSRLLSALLTGVNRAHPYLPQRKRDAAFEKHVDALYRVVHTSAPGTSTQALLLLFHATIMTVRQRRPDNNDGDDDSGDDSGDDEEHDSDQDDDVGSQDRNTNNAAPTPEQEKKRERFYRALYSTLSNPSMLGSGKHLTLFFNLLYKALKYDDDDSRVVAFAKRILSTALHCGPPVLAGGLFLLNEVSKYRPAVRSCGCDVVEGPDGRRVLDYSKREPRGALVLLRKDAAPSENPTDNQSKDNDDNAAVKIAPLWEFALTNHHYHPTVGKFTSMYGGEIQYTGDPLKDFALAPFLDKFAYRNPKSAEKAVRSGGGTHMRRNVAADRRRRAMQAQAGAAPVNDPAFWEQQDEVQVQDEFFYKFFVERAKRDKIKGIVRRIASGGTGDGKRDGDEDGGSDRDGDDDQEALDAAESNYVGGKSFDEYENQWETDSEEEAFVDALAEKIMEDRIGGAGERGITELDDEDPDMEGWSDDFDDDSDDDDDEEAEEDEDNTGNKGVSKEPFSNVDEEDEEMDAFMDDDDDDDDMDEDSDGDGPQLDGEDRIASFADDDGDSSEDEERHIPKNLDEELESVEDAGSSKEKAKKKKAVASTFATAEEYEALINESFSKLRRPNILRNVDREENDETEHAKVNSSQKKRQKKRRRKT